MIKDLTLGLLRFLLTQIKRAVAGLLTLGIAAIIGGGLFVAIANYTATQGTGTTFASVVISGTHYLGNMLCDFTVGQTACATVKIPNVAAAGSDTSVVTQISPNSPTNLPAVSNASSAVATTATNVPNTSYNYGFNGSTWDQLQVDGSKNLKVTQAGSTSNGSSGVAISSTNGATVGWNYIFNNATSDWDQLQGTGGAANVRITANTAVGTDPCLTGNKLSINISQTSSAQIITGTAAKKTYVCSFAWNGSDAENISLVEGTGTVCATNIFALVGGTTAAAGNNFGANGGIAQSGAGFVLYGSADANATAANVCLLQSGSGRVAGYITYVQN